MNRIAFAMVILSVPACLAQKPAVPPVRFEVASIKPCKPDFSVGQRSGLPISTSGGRLVAVCAPVRALIQLAYLTYANGTYRDFNFYDVPIERAPGWIQSEYYSIEAKAEARQSEGSILGPMLRDLLEDRFQLVIRRVSRDIPVYDLVVGRGGSKLMPFDRSCKPFIPAAADRSPAADGCRNAAGVAGSNLTRFWHGITIDDFVSAVLDMQFVGRPVVNKTGITGLFDIHLEFMPEQNSGMPNAGPSIFTALQEQLGLRLVPARGTEEVLVIDRVDRPSEN